MNFNNYMLINIIFLTFYYVINLKKDWKYIFDERDSFYINIYVGWTIFLLISFTYIILIGDIK